MNDKARRLLILKSGKALALILMSCGLTAQLSMPASAQGFDTPPVLLEQTPVMGPDPSTFVPPEVVPQADTSGAGQMTMTATAGQLTEINPPAHMNMHPTSGTQSARELRKAMFDSLMGNTQLSNNQAASLDPMNSDFLQETPALNRQFSPDQNAVGQPDWLLMGGNLSPGASPGGQLAGYGNTGLTQTQTLTAGSKIPIVRRDIRRAGFANNLSGVAGLGSALLTTRLRRPNSLLGLGFTGLAITGFGVRNGFRF